MPRLPLLGFSKWGVLTLTVVLLGGAFVVGTILLRPSCIYTHEMAALHRMKQLHLATLQMELDRSITDNTNIGWPGDLDSSVATWASNLIAGHYLTTNELRSLLFAGGTPPADWQLPTRNTNSLLLYAAGTNSRPETVFLSTANFTNTPTGGLPLLGAVPPYGRKSFAVIRQAGCASLLSAQDAGHTNTVGAYAPLCH